MDPEANQLIMQILNARAKNTNLSNELYQSEKYRNELRLHKMRMELEMIQSNIQLKEQQLKTVHEDISMIESGKVFVGKSNGADYILQ